MQNKIYFADNQFHNIMRDFEFLPNLSFTISKMIADYYF